MKNQTENQANDSIVGYVIGFVISVALTFFAYYLVVNHCIAARWSTAGVIAGLAIVQFIVQLYYFLGLRIKTKPRWQLAVLLFMIFIVLILVGGSIWIMASLNDRMIMTPDQVNQYMQDQVGL